MSAPGSPLRWLACAILACGGPLISVRSQDIAVQAPQWIPGSTPGTRLPPSFTHPPRLNDALVAKTTPEYAIVVTHYEGPQRPTRVTCYATSDAAKAAGEDLSKRLHPKNPAGTPQQPLEAWYGVVVNPASAATKGPNATPRLLDVKPIPLTLSEARQQPQSRVRVRIPVAADGAIGEVEILSSTPQPFAARIIETVRQWRFAPARRDGQAIAATVEIPAVFLIPNALIGGPTAPLPLRTVDPTYPVELRGTGLTGEVRLSFLVTIDGRATQATVEHASHRQFEAPALEAIKQWEFRPAERGGVPTPCRISQTLTFVPEATSALSLSHLFDPTAPTPEEKLPQPFQPDAEAIARDLPAPIYPYALIDKGTRGKVMAFVHIDEKGHVCGVRIINSSRDEFSLAYTAALEAATFAPARKGGRAVPSAVLLQQEFIPDKLLDARAQRMWKRLSRKPDSIVQSTTLDTPPHPLTQRRPVVPTAYDPAQAGSAKVEFVVDEQGAVLLPRIVETTDPMLGYAAMQAVLEWTFAPPTQGGRPVATRVVAPFNFGPGKAQTAQTTRPEIVALTR